MFKEVCKIFKIKKIYTTPYHCQSNYVERNHYNIENYLRIFTNNNDEWDQLLPFYVFSYNTTICTSTQYTPFEIAFGREAKLPYQNIEKLTTVYNYDDYVASLKYTLQKIALNARENIIRAKEIRKKRYDQNTCEMKYDIGDQVKIKANNNKIGGKTDQRWKSPYTITETNSPQYVTLLIDGKKKKYHKNFIAPYYTNDPEDDIHTDNLDVEIEDSEER